MQETSLDLQSKPYEGGCGDQTKFSESEVVHKETSKVLCHDSEHNKGQRHGNFLWLCSDFPQEVFLVILSFQSPKFVLNQISCTCKAWYHLVMMSEYLWRNYLMDCYGVFWKQQLEDTVHHDLSQEEQSTLTHGGCKSLELFCKISKKLNSRRILVRDKIVYVTKKDSNDECQAVYEIANIIPLLQNSDHQRNRYYLSDIPVEYRDGGFHGCHLYDFTKLYLTPYVIDLYLAVDTLSPLVDQLLFQRSDTKVESTTSQIASSLVRKLGGIRAASNAFEFYDFSGRLIWSQTAQTMLHFRNERKNYASRYLNCIYIYHYHKLDYLILAVNGGIKVITQDSARLIWEDEDGPNTKILLNDAINLKFGIVTCLNSDFTKFFAWNVENGERLWSVTLSTLIPVSMNAYFSAIKAFAVKRVICGQYWIESRSEEDTMTMLLHATSGRPLIFFDGEWIRDMHVVSIREFKEPVETIVTTLFIYSLSRIALIQSTCTYNKEKLASMSIETKWESVPCDQEIVLESANVDIVKVPLTGSDIRKRMKHSHRCDSLYTLSGFDDINYSDLDDMFKFDLIILSIYHNDLIVERFRTDNGDLLYRTLLTPKNSLSTPIQTHAPITNVNRESSKIFAEVRGRDLFIVRQPNNTASDCIIILDLESGSEKCTLVCAH
ncbi:hypothetical protein FDP41_000323 [Naegleria fowleri]|uniref:F-box domain-containing protein n=1 Tax=Naegleria fowleri TaxID=5763 RepID=A0A6A5CCY8_NAEFO|nr:uncharacterized protein FDP41_000323 [Naegleria fowleri]KAF0984424.1 hypothetical protein FDP41_000323 [Naegleria fowleri]CAG4715248.1 unnamed protein product [Naegleria fowleri]